MLITSMYIGLPAVDGSKLKLCLDIGYVQLSVRPDLTDCEKMRQPSLAVHFAHSSLHRLNLELADRPQIMTRAMDRFWECQTSP